MDILSPKILVLGGLFVVKGFPVPQPSGFQLLCVPVISVKTRSLVSLKKYPILGLYDILVVAKNQGFAPNKNNFFHLCPNIHKKKCPLS